MVIDDEDRENEGDLIFPAESLTEPQMAMLIRECSGIVCLCLPPEKIDSLGLPMMVEDNSCRYRTAFTVSIDAAKGITTGVSAGDRLTTVHAAITNGAKPEDLCRPGHVFPLRARDGGVVERPGHTEATVDLMRLADRVEALFKAFAKAVDMALERMGLEISDVLMVGDMLLTDIKGAIDIGMDSALVLTGMNNREDVEKIGIRPTFVIESLRELVNA